MRLSRTSALMLGALTLPAFAQKIENPVLGYVLDREIHRIRPIWGAIGAAVVGDPLESGQDIFAVVSSSQNRVLVLAGGRRAASSFDPATGDLQPLPGVRPGASLLVLSSTGASVALYFAERNAIQVINGSAAPVEISVAELARPLAALSVSDDAAVVLVTDANSEAVAIQTGGDLRRNRIAIAAPVSAATFLPATHDALLASAAETILVRDVIQPSGRTVLPGASLAGVARDGRTAILADLGSSRIRLIDLKQANGTPVEFDCRCSPTEIVPVNSAGAFRLAGYTGDALPMFEVGLSEIKDVTTRVFVVPPVADSVN